MRKGKSVDGRLGRPTPGGHRSPHTYRPSHGPRGGLRPPLGCGHPWAAPLHMRCGHPIRCSHVGCGHLIRYSHLRGRDTGGSAQHMGQAVEPTSAACGRVASPMLAKGSGRTSASAPMPEPGQRVILRLRRHGRRSTPPDVGRADRHLTQTPRHRLVAGCVFAEDIVGAFLQEPNNTCTDGKPRQCVDDVTLQVLQVQGEFAEECARNMKITSGHFKDALIRDNMVLNDDQHQVLRLTVEEGMAGARAGCW